jgi:hypothetical protein
LESGRQLQAQVRWPRALDFTLGHQPHHRENDREGDGSAHLDQIALPCLFKNRRSKDGVHQLTKVRPRHQPNTRECRNYQPAPKPRGREAEQSKDQSRPPNRKERGFPIHSLMYVRHQLHAR